MSLERVEIIIRWIGGLLAYVTLAMLLFGIWRGTRRRAGRTTGHSAVWLRSAWFYFISSLLFFGICYLGWIPLPLMVSTQARLWMLILGSLLYFPGMSLALWARLALGKDYFVSTSFGAQLFAEHHLLTSGPYAVVRHPMYIGIFLAALGSLLVYFTWTTLLFVCFAPLFTFRARREEAALAEEFGEKWQEYRMRVPAFIPRLKL
jgi:protein-S-isoprenylcysteine O-methyltransferase Ste14